MKRRHNQAPTSTITDIAFLLLLFFLILAISTQHTPVPIEPASTHADRLEYSELPTLVVSKEGIIFLDSIVTELKAIPTQQAYVLLADSSTPYEVLHPVITFLKQIGVEKLYCLVEDKV
ncbi:MAG: biopolymer transporter ExbD [Sphaerochaeta sp.]